MLVLLAAEGARLDAGSVGLALARRWCDADSQVLYMDADTSGSRLARRLGEIERADYSPTVRGLPSLMVARKPLTLRLLADHCYSLDTAAGSLWVLFAPVHPDGGQHAARWLAERSDDLVAVDRERRVVLSTSLRTGGEHLRPVLQAAPVVVVVAPVESDEQARGIWTRCRDAGLMGFERRHRALVVEGDSELDDDQIAAETGMHVAGRLPVIDDERVLRLQGGRRDRAFGRSLDNVARRLLALQTLDDAAAGTALEADAPTPVPQPLAGTPAEIAARDHAGTATGIDARDHAGTPAEIGGPDGVAVNGASARRELAERAPDGS